MRRIMNAHELEIKVSGRTKLIEVLGKLPEPVKNRIFTSEYKISPSIMILVNNVDVKSQGIENVYVEDGDRVVLIPIIHGG